jgi:Flp pilus assembly protein TadD
VPRQRFLVSSSAQARTSFTLARQRRRPGKCTSRPAGSGWAASCGKTCAPAAIRLPATAEDVRFRNPACAVELAAKAVQGSPKNAELAGTLGTARYRTGDWKQAAQDLERAIRHRSPKDPRNANESFFLAMACWQLGDRAGARTWFDRGIALMDRDKARDDEVRRFRAEAAELLGIKDEARRPDQQAPR